MDRTPSAARSVRRVIVGVAAGGLAGGVVALCVTLLVRLFWVPGKEAPAAVKPQYGGVVGAVVAFGQSAEEYQVSMQVLGVQVVAVLAGGLVALIAALCGTALRGFLLGAIGPALLCGGLLYFELPQLRENKYMKAIGENNFIGWALTLNVLAGGAAGLVGGLIGRRYCWAAKARGEPGTVQAGDALRSDAGR